MGIINRYATGLLTVLDSQTQGDTPSSLGDVIAPTLDMWPFFLGNMGLSQRNGTESHIAPAIAGSYSKVTVPEAEVWLVQRVLSRITNNHAALSITIRLIPYVQLYLGSVAFPFSNNANKRQAVSPDETATNSQEFSAPGLIVRGGAVFGSFAEAMSLAVPSDDCDIYTQVQYYKLQN